MEPSNELKKSRKSAIRKSVHFQADFPVSYLTKEEYLIKKHIPSEVPDTKNRSQPLESLFFQPSVTRNPFRDCDFGADISDEVAEKTRKIEDQKLEIDQAEVFIKDLLEQLSQKSDEIRVLEEKLGLLEQDTGKERQSDDGAVQTEVGAVQTEDGAVQTEDWAVQTEDGAVQTEKKKMKSQEIQVFMETEPVSALKDEIERLTEELEERNSELVEKAEMIGLLETRQNEENERFFSNFKEIMQDFMSSKERLIEQFVEGLHNMDNRIRKAEGDVSRFHEIAQKNKDFVKKTIELGKKLSAMECAKESLNRKNREFEVKIKEILAEFQRKEKECAEMRSASEAGLRRANESEERLRRIIEKTEKERGEFAIKIEILGKENERLVVLLESLENEKKLLKMNNERMQAENGTRSKSLQMALEKELTEISQGLQAKITELESENQQLREEKEGMELKLIELADELGNSHILFENLQQKIEELNERKLLLENTLSEVERGSRESHEKTKKSAKNMESENSSLMATMKDLKAKSEAEKADFDAKIRDFRVKLDGLKAENEGLRASLEDVRAKNKDLLFSNEEIMGSLGEKERHLDELGKKSLFLVGENERLMGIVVEMDRSRMGLSSENEKLSDLLNETQAKLAALESEAVRIQGFIVEGQKSSIILREENEKLRVSLVDCEKRLEKNNEKYRESFEESRRKSDYLEKAMKELEAELKSVTSQKTELERSIARLSSDNQSISLMLDKAGGEIKDLQREKTDLASCLDSAEKRLRSAHKERESLSISNADIEKKLGLVLQEKENLSSTQEKAEQILRSIEKENEGLKSSLANLENKSENMSILLENSEKKNEVLSAEYTRLISELEVADKNNEKLVKDNTRLASELESSLKKLHLMGKENERVSGLLNRAEARVLELQKKLDLAEFSLFSLRKENQEFKQGLLTVESSYLNEMDELKRVYREDMAKTQAIIEEMRVEQERTLKAIIQEKNEEFREKDRVLLEISQENHRLLRKSEEKNRDARLVADLRAQIEILQGELAKSKDESRVNRSKLKISAKEASPAKEKDLRMAVFEAELKKRALESADFRKKDAGHWDNKENSPDESEEIRSKMEQYKRQCQIIQARLFNEKRLYEQQQSKLEHSTIKLSEPNLEDSSNMSIERLTSVADFQSPAVEDDDMAVGDEGNTHVFNDSSFGNVLNTLGSSLDNNS